MNQIYESQHGTYSTDMKQWSCVYAYLCYWKHQWLGPVIIIHLPVNSSTKLEHWRWCHLQIHNLMIWIYMSSPRISAKMSYMVLASDWPALLRTYTLHKTIQNFQQMNFLHCVRLCVCVIQCWYMCMCCTCIFMFM